MSKKYTNKRKYNKRRVKSLRIKRRNIKGGNEYNEAWCKELETYRKKRKEEERNIRNMIDMINKGETQITNADIVNKLIEYQVYRDLTYDEKQTISVIDNTINSVPEQYFDEESYKNEEEKKKNILTNARNRLGYTLRGQQPYDPFGTNQEEINEAGMNEAGMNEAGMNEEYAGINPLV